MRALSGHLLGKDLSGALQLTLVDEPGEGGIPVDAPLWVMIFRNGVCLYRNASGNVVPAMSLTQAFSGSGLEDVGAINSPTMDFYEVNFPFLLAGMSPGIDNEIDTRGKES